MNTREIIPLIHKRLSHFLLGIIILLIGSLSWATVDNKSQAWSIVRYTYNFSDNFVGGQLQNRYDLDVGEGFEEQINLFVGSYWRGIEYKFIGTLGTQNAYEKKREIRYAIEGEKDFSLNSSFVYNLRLRQEVRDFTAFNDLAYRFRIRNEMGKNFNDCWFSGVTLSSEVNIYLNDYTPGASGFSSHRTILTGLFQKEKSVWGVSYLNDYRKNSRGDESRHILQLTLELENKK